MKAVFFHPKRNDAGGIFGGEITSLFFCGKDKKSRRSQGPFPDRIPQKGGVTKVFCGGDGRL